MRMPDQEPTEVPSGAPECLREKTYEHPAFGQVTVSRVQGGTTLYGSDFVHHAFVELTIHRSRLNRSLSRDWHSAGKELVSIRLSEAQWATLVSSFNCGAGTPCTIDHVQGERAPGIPLRTEREVTESELKERCERVSEHIMAAMRDVEQTCAGLSKKARDAVLERMRLAYREVSDSMPFAAKSFAEHTEKTVEKAKTEVHAYMAATINRAGLLAIAAGAPSVAQLPMTPPIQLGNG